MTRRRKNQGGRKIKPEEGERCVRDHDPDWVQYKSGEWFCRTCRNESNKAWRKHARMTNPEKVRKDDRERRARYLERHPEKREQYAREQRERMARKQNEG